MTEPSTSQKFRDKTYLREQQYKDSSNLDARAALHRRFSTAKTDWPVWVFDQLELQPGEKVLECGGEPGWLWRTNQERIPPDCHITFTDYSPGMVAEAEAALADANHQFTFQSMNVEEIPFADNSFDVVIANHMLYHVPDLNKALAEIRRVLKPDGRFFAATNGDAHMHEMWEIAAQILPDQQAAYATDRATGKNGIQLNFRLENGAEWLEPHFQQIEMHGYPDSLEVTEAAPFLAYIRSMLNVVDDLNETEADTVLSRIRQIIDEKGAIPITKASGLFVAH